MDLVAPEVTFDAPDHPVGTVLIAKNSPYGHAVRGTEFPLLVVQPAEKTVRIWNHGGGAIGKLEETQGPSQLVVYVQDEGQQIRSWYQEMDLPFRKDEKHGIPERTTTTFHGNEVGPATAKHHKQIAEMLDNLEHSPPPEERHKRFKVGTGLTDAIRIARARLEQKSAVEFGINQRHKYNALKINEHRQIPTLPPEMLDKVENFYVAFGDM